MQEKLSTTFQIVDLKAQYQRLKPEIDSAIFKVLEDANFINGEPVKTFSKEIAEFVESPYFIPCANGTDALQIAYMALGLEPGDEVILPAFNYVATAEAAALLKLKPVFVDCQADTFNIDPNQIEGAITPKTRAIVAVHLFGQSCDMEAIMEIAEKHNLFVIEDNAQAIGSKISTGKYAERKSGTIGHIGTTSFFPSKNLGCMGDGGGLFTNDAVLKDVIQKIANHGQQFKYQYESIGINSRLDTIKAAILSVKIKHLNSFTENRQKAAEAYDLHLGQLPELQIPARTKYSSHVFHQYTIKLSSEKVRDGLKSYLNDKGIQSMIYYPKPLHLQPGYLYLGYNNESFPVSSLLSQQVLSLPMHSELTKSMVETISGTVSAFMENL
jgi:dTDP-4-amino-4,6-dideoxygalactose transaminase